MFSIAQGLVWRVERDVEADDGSVRGCWELEVLLVSADASRCPYAPAFREPGAFYCGVNILAALPGVSAFR